ncbi:MAG: hypothetical protein DDT32_01981 [Syntrophomonadaceae bacterium]|nr:hypothetical protein [Bacillota bacterium]MBT9148211.1 hypothetical protein [Bacillota bacterium]
MINTNRFHTHHRGTGDYIPVAGDARVPALANQIIGIAHTEWIKMVPV